MWSASPAERRAPHTAGAAAVMMVSGFAGIGYQLVWSQRFAVWLGHEIAATLAVVAAFFGGIALGAWLLGPRVAASAAPARWYAASEALIALWSAALVWLADPLGERVLALIGAEAGALRQWTLAFGGTFVLLLPATAAIGLTLPAMERLCRARPSSPRTVALLYASNTAGAVLGVLALAFVLGPALGMARAALLCAALNLACAAAVLRVWRRPAPVVSAVPAVPAVRGAGGMPVRLFVTGLLGIGYEVIAVRVLGQVSAGTVYSFALLLAVYLAASALGAALYAARAPRTRRRWVRDRLLALTALACLAGTGTLWFAAGLMAAVQALLGASMGSALLGEALVALAAFALPSLAMGALFAHLGAMALASGTSLGRALAANTLGAALAPALFGVLLFPRLGAKLALLAIVAGYLSLMRARAWNAQPAAALMPAMGAGALALAAPPIAFVDLPAGGRILRYEDGVMAAVSVVQDAQGVSRLRIDNREQEGSSATGRVDSRQGLLPVLLHPQPRRALFLGLGTGATARAAARAGGVEVDAVELVPEVVEAAALFRDGAEPPSLRVVTADARRYVRTAARRYDVIVADNVHPARSGSAALYTVEHFAAVRARLAADGVFCQWLPLHQMEGATLRIIVASFLRVFPQAHALLASYSLETPVLGLVAMPAGDARLHPDAVQARLSGHARREFLARIGIEDAHALLGSFVAGPAALRAYAQGAALNTDDHPRVAWRAPRAAYAGDTPAERLIALLQVLRVEPAELVPGIDAQAGARLAAYWAARDRFVVAGRAVQRSSDPRRMLAQVRAPLLDVLRISADFRPAYDPLLRLAEALAPLDPVAARELLAQLAALQPARDDAAGALQRLAAAVR